MTLRNLLVAGAGQMGTGIAQVALQAGLQVTLFDIAQAQLDKARARIDAGLDKSQKRGKLVDVTLDEAKAALTTTSDFPTRRFDLVIEAAPENASLKCDLLARLADAVDDGGFMATNTSSLSITRLAKAVRHPDAFIGLHFMNPVPLMALVEVIPGLATSEATRAQAIAFVNRLGKTPITCRDLPGFAVNRLLIPMLNEACFALLEGVSSPQEIDDAMRLGAGMPMGPLALADMIGLDTCLAIMEVMQDGFGDDKYRPCPLLRQYVDAGWLGKKTGRGFFTYG